MSRNCGRSASAWAIDRSRATNPAIQNQFPHARPTAAFSCSNFRSQGKRRVISPRGKSASL